MAEQRAARAGRRAGARIAPPLLSTPRSPPMWRSPARSLGGMGHCDDGDARHGATVLHTQGVNIMAFCKEYNAATSKMAGEIIPVEITVYEVRCAATRWSAEASSVWREERWPWRGGGDGVCLQRSGRCDVLAGGSQDRSFTFILKTPPASVLLKKAAGALLLAGEAQQRSSAAAASRSSSGSSNSSRSGRGRTGWEGVDACSAHHRRQWGRYDARGRGLQHDTFGR